MDLGGAVWRKSSRSSGSGSGDCVEVAADLPGGGVAVRDSKDPHGPVLSFTPNAWEAFVAATRAGVFDRR